MKKLFALFCFLASLAYSANHYIRSGASGSSNGTDWTNAWPTFAAANLAGFTRGDTYYVADGTYSERLYVNVAVSTTLWIYFKKATIADHGTATGWLDTYGDGVATITSADADATLDLDKGYISWDGQVGSGTTGHGFHIVNTAQTEGAKVYHVENGNTGPISFSHVDIEGGGFAGSANGTQGIYYLNFTATKGNYIGYCWIHNTTINGSVITKCVGTSYSDYGLLFENNVVSETGGCTDPAKHGQGMQLGQQTEMGYIVIRNNVYRNIVGSGMIVFLTSGDGCNHHDVLIYNNIFYITDTATYSVISPGAIWHEPQGSHTGTVIANFQILNNSFYNITGSTNLAQIVLNTTGIVGTGNVLKNNVWEKCTITSNHSGVTQTTNAYQTSGTGTNTGAGLAAAASGQITGSATTFTSAATYDFTLAAGGYAVGVGTDQSSLFTTYADGTTRTGTWNDGPLPLAAGTAGGSVFSGSLSLSGNIKIN